MDTEYFDEKELEKLFSHQKKSPGKFKTFTKFFFSFVLLYLIIFGFINYSGLLDNITYWYKTEYLNQNYSNNSKVTELSALTKTSITNTNKSLIPNISDNHLKIDLIDVLAPVTWRVENNPDAVTAGLANGLIQLNGTALPGESGNVFITGHSSDYPWSKGHYKNVFVLLNKLSVGDVVQLKYQNKDYLYKVSSIKTVTPNDLSVLEGKNQSTLTLMTCTPIGTTLRRLIVVSDQIYPDPSGNKKQTNTGTSNKLPAPR